jgi:hypothetical protein
MQESGDGRLQALPEDIGKVISIASLRGVGMKELLKRISAGVVMIVFIAMGSCVQAKTFKGRVIDADTKEPIAGAVVVAVWKTETTTPTATHSNLKEVKECLTDKDGEWSIMGPKGRADEPIPGSSLFIPYTKEPEFIVFKPGYCSWPNGFSIDACRNRIKIIGGKDGGIGEGGTLELPKLTSREDRLKAERIEVDPTGEIFADKQKAREIKNFLRLLNEEKRFLGLDEYPLGKELENEK